MTVNHKKLPNRYRRSRAGLGVLAMGLALAACGDDEKPRKPESGGADACSAAELEPDLDAQPFVGPAADPETGELRLESGKSYVVSSTYGVPVPGENGAPVTPQYLALFGAIEAQLAEQPGLLALKLASSERCGSGRTLAVWSSEEEMYAFVASDAHFNAMKSVKVVLKPGFSTTHWSASRADQMTWDEAVKQLALD
jgi:heme-degrading monooxygenase HmoA